MSSKDGAEKIVGAGAEGGGFRLYGRRRDAADVGGGESAWVFWRESSECYYLEEDGEEVSYTSQSEETDDLASACPANLFRLYPTSEIYPEFASWFRQALETHRQKLGGAATESIAARQMDIFAEWDRVIAEAEGSRRVADNER